MLHCVYNIRVLLEFRSVRLGTNEEAFDYPQYAQYATDDPPHLFATSHCV